MASKSDLTRGQDALICVGLILIGAAVAFFWGLPLLDSANASTRWPYVKGQLKSSKIHTYESRAGSGGSSESYVPEIVYKYTVGNKDYESDSIWYGIDGSLAYDFRSDAEVYTTRYPQGAEMKVFYDPEDPATATLETGPSAVFYLPLFFGVLFIAIGLCRLCYPLVISVYNAKHN